MELTELQEKRRNVDHMSANFHIPETNSRIRMAMGRFSIYRSSNSGRQNGLHQGKSSQWVYSAVITAGGSADSLGEKKKGWWPKTLYPLPGAQHSVVEESVSPSVNLRDA
jgi:hypothetical protein